MMLRKATYCVSTLSEGPGAFLTRVPIMNVHPRSATCQHLRWVKTLGILQLMSLCHIGWGMGLSVWHLHISDLGIIVKISTSSILTKENGMLGAEMKYSWHFIYIWSAQFGRSRVCLLFFGLQVVHLHGFSPTANLGVPRTFHCVLDDYSDRVQTWCEAFRCKWIS